MTERVDGEEDAAAGEEEEEETRVEDGVVQAMRTALSETQEVRFLTEEGRSKLDALTIGVWSGGDGEPGRPICCCKARRAMRE